MLSLSRAVYLLIFFIFTSHSYSQSLKIAAFNVQTFGQTKGSKADVMDYLAQIVAGYDIVFIQEIRDSLDGEVITRLARLAGEKISVDYGYTISAELGRSSYRERYAYLYRTDKASLVDAWVYDDSGNDLFTREPYIAVFSSGSDLFTTVGIHVAPGAAGQEIPDLVAVTDSLLLSGTQKILLFGDFNADCSYFNPISTPLISLFESSTSWISDSADTTVSSTDCAYDRIISLGSIHSQLSNPSVLNFENSFRISNTKAREISDHYPVSITMTLGDSSGTSPSPSPDLPDSCGLEPYWTPGGYCYATFEGVKKRVSASCCSY